MSTSLGYRLFRGLRQVKHAVLGGKPGGNAYLAMYQFLAKVRRRWAGQPTDDFDWKLYNLHYRGEMESLAREHVLLLGDGDYKLVGGRLQQRNGAGLPLHPNWKLLYETALDLGPSSVLEVGCGNGMHLRNFQVLSPGLELNGLDRSAEQLGYLRELHPDLQARVGERDVTLPFPKEMHASVDLAYTQAVVMHIQTRDLHREALTNLFRAARKQVVLMENWERHPFLEDVQSLHAAGRTGWKEMHLYYRPSEPAGGACLMVCSAEPLSYPVLEDYRQLLEPDSPAA